MSSASSPSAALISAIRAQSSSLNLLPLQRIDGAIQAVVLTAKHSVLYMLDQDTEKWEREDVEGPFFLVERSSPPYYAMVILNRRSIDNFFQEIRASMAFEIQEQSEQQQQSSACTQRAQLARLQTLTRCGVCAECSYLFFQVNDDVIGVWFYEQPEAVQAAEALNGSAPAQLRFREAAVASLSSLLISALPSLAVQDCAQPAEPLLPTPSPSSLHSHRRSLSVLT